MSDSPDSQFHQLKTQVSLLGERVQEMNASLREMASAMRKLVLIEERQVEDKKALGRAFDRLDELAKAHTDLVNRVALMNQRLRSSSRWVDMAVGAIVSGAGLFISKKLGLM